MEPVLDWLQITVLALIQGLTEFLPISSSGHLILVPQLFGWQDQGLAFDVAVHIGTLSAVVLYFRNDIRLMVIDWTRSLITRQPTSNSRLAWWVILATLPAIAFGFVINNGLEESLRNPLIIAATTIGFGILLWWSDIKGQKIRDEYSLSFKDITVIGFAQALALIPGTSRSGITITAALLVGLTPQAAARFSFLLSIPIILGAGILKLKDLLESSHPVQWQAMIGGTLLSAISAYIVIALFLKWINRVGMAPFALYRFALGALLIYLFI
ncbi:undecaprenyl-diphosphate phosphatase [Thiomicrorhabdus sp. 6S3-12]|uniref:undecaprenyl-diphosphate phosphatase n=1 Tax=Thiomicrorhabdus sp. 6S3-12 TaxID=2819681 RepID=UPI001AADCF02|nr:undecaprenyl-diphosphate phosphatase [Thiomicrorhabdus sp. 6S3-12]MBO1923876.1 undecaprenyl-diphosphate phosphatase [Thiomicrorhabdus sp. 6S3-12]